MEFRFLLLAMIILLAGCVSEKTRTVTETIYVCPDQSMVSDPEKCDRLEPEKVIVTNYVCPDGSISEKEENCPEPEPFLVEVMMYVCPDGSVVNGSEGCHQPELGTTPTTETTTTTQTTETTKTTTTTTTTETTTTTQAEGSCTALGCPSGTEFVGSKSSDKYHLCTCRYAKKIKPDNIVCFSSKQDAESQGYVPCGTCINE
jgi:hypothetical protein